MIDLILCFVAWPIGMGLAYFFVMKNVKKLK